MLLSLLINSLRPESFFYSTTDFSNILLASDGSDLAEYLLSIYKLDNNVFNGIVETLQYILPYAHDLQASVTSEFERNVYLQLTENDC